MTTETLSPRLLPAVRERLTRSRYVSEEELLFAALDALDWREAVDDSIQASLDDMAAGRVEPVAGLADRIRERAASRRG